MRRDGWDSACPLSGGASPILEQARRRTSGVPRPSVRLCGALTWIAVMLLFGCGRQPIVSPDVPAKVRQVVPAVRHANVTVTGRAVNRSRAASFELVLSPVGDPWRGKLIRPDNASGEFRIEVPAGSYKLWVCERNSVPWGETVREVTATLGEELKLGDIDMVAAARPLGACKVVVNGVPPEEIGRLSLRLVEHPTINPRNRARNAPVDWLTNWGPHEVIYTTPSESSVVVATIDTTGETMVFLTWKDLAAKLR